MISSGQTARRSARPVRPPRAARRMPVVNPCAPLRALLLPQARGLLQDVGQVTYVEYGAGKGYLRCARKDALAGLHFRPRSWGPHLGNL